MTGAVGLDARAAAIVMKAVKNTVRTGRTVVCTIHQPSLEIFQVQFTCTNACVELTFACSHVLLRSLLIQRMVSMAWAAINTAMAQCNRHADLHALKLWLVVCNGSLLIVILAATNGGSSVWALASTAQGVFTELW